MNIVELKSTKNLYMLKESIKDYFSLILHDKPLYFVTLTFPVVWREKPIQEHLSKIRYYLKLSNRRKKNAKDNFDYFWIKEQSKHRNIHFHMVINWNYSNYNKIQKDWNYIIKQPATSPSTHVDRIITIESINKCIDYIYKDVIDLEDDGRIQSYGMSRNLSEFLSNQMREKHLTFAYSVL